ncbi:MAG: hypothetical protein KA224_01265 [Steroidobacteraceae bacterium]|nr:hypothetical protein [Steroidobacteraceae bacterium]MCC7200136.1 hypothetical protein [Gammaproteobacteria bacterium]
MARPGSSTSVLAATLCAAFCALLWALPACASPGPGSHGSPLFDEHTELAVVLKYPVRRMLRDPRAKEELAGMLHYQGPDGREASLSIKVRARGNTRLDLCDFPPLRLEFDPAQTAGTPFAGEKHLKLVTHCRPGNRYADYVRLEQRIYRAYGLITPASFKTRALAVTYVDSVERMVPVAAPAFLMEDGDDMAGRIGMREARMSVLNPADVDPVQTGLMELFQFMIGNTDWSAYAPKDGSKECCHNGHVLRPVRDGGKFVVVPFDFDYAGLIDAEYAAVSRAAGVRRVRQRIYRGLCAHNDQVPASIRRFQEVRPQLEALFEGGGIGKVASHRALVYVQEFYGIIGDATEVQRWIYDYCRPGPTGASAPMAVAASADPASLTFSSLGRMP